MRKIFTYISLSFFSFGILGFLYNMKLASDGNDFDGELPLTSIQEIKEKNDKIYIGLGFYSRIQVYDINGKYLHYIKTKNYMKDFNFTIDNEGKEHINVIFTRKEIIDKHIQDNGNIYFINKRFPLTINRINKNIEKSVIKQRLDMTFWGGPITSWLIGFIGLLLFCIFNIFIIMEVFGENITTSEKIKLLSKRIFK